MAVAADLGSRQTSHTDESVGTSYLDRLPRRLVVLYLPLALFVFVLLFPFYWMTVTALKPNPIVSVVPDGAVESRKHPNGEPSPPGPPHGPTGTAM